MTEVRDMRRFTGDGWLPLDPLTSAALSPSDLVARSPVAGGTTPVGLTSAARTAAVAVAPCGGSAVVSGSWQGGSLVVQNGAERQLCSSPGVASAHGQQSHEIQQPQQRAPLPMIMVITSTHVLLGE